MNIPYQLIGVSFILYAQTWNIVFLKLSLVLTQLHAI